MKVFTAIVTFALFNVNLVSAVRYNRPPIPIAPGSPVGIYQVTSVQGTGGPTEINVASGWSPPLAETVPFTEHAPPALQSHPEPPFVPAPLQMQMTPEAMQPTVSHIPAPAHEQLAVLSNPEPVQSVPVPEILSPVPETPLSIPETVQSVPVPEILSPVPETPLSIPETVPVVPQTPAVSIPEPPAPKPEIPLSIPETVAAVPQTPAVTVPEPPAPEPETPLSIPEPPSHVPEQISAVNPAFIPIPVLGASVNTFGTLNASQAANSGQTISFNAAGDGMNINFSSVVGADSGADLTQGGSDINVDLQNGEITTTSGETSASTFLIPDSDIGLQVSGANNVGMEVESHALGSENVDSQVAHQSVVYIYDPALLSSRS